MGGIIMSYQDDYNNARNRFYNACNEINYCENRLGILRDQRQKNINLINQLKTELRNTREARESVEAIIREETRADSHIRNITGKMDSASSNYNRMVDASDVSVKNLNDVYAQEALMTQQKKNQIFEQLTTQKNALDKKIEELENQLKQAEIALQETENSIRNTQQDLEDNRRAKNSASADMDYYQRKIREEEARQREERERREREERDRASSSYSIF
jgi:chromosome segregation ATPase